jgi:hypothetical protein
MNILDENIVSSARRWLEARRIHFRQIGIELGRAGMKDRGEIIPLLHSLRNPTFFTRDRDFYKAELCSSKYCIVFLDVAFDEAAPFIRGLLRHKDLRSQRQRMGWVVRVHRSGLSYWRMNSKKQRQLPW